MSIGFPGLSVQANKSVSAKIRKYNPVNQPIRFGDSGDTTEFKKEHAIEEEFRRLCSEAPDTITSLERKPRPLINLFEVVKRPEKLLRQRAEYNITGNKDLFLDYLPYRKMLNNSKQQSKLVAYDNLTQKILDKTSFWEVPNHSEFYNALEDFQRKKGNISRNKFFQFVMDFFYGIKQKVLDVLVKFSPNFRRSYCLRLAEKIQKNGNAISEKNLLQFLEKQQTKEAKVDPSTKYIIAAGIAELLHKKPEYANEVLSRRFEGGKPFRIVITKGNPSILVGQYRFGMNLLWMNQFMSWANAQKKYHISQHEFIHAISENSDFVSLPPAIMNEKQKQEFLKIRNKLVSQYKSKDQKICENFLSETSTGLPYYAFKDDMEFLTVSLDIFKAKPEKLRQTDAGKELYDLYKEIFAIDPLNDLNADVDEKSSKATGLEGAKFDSALDLHAKAS